MCLQLPFVPCCLDVPCCLESAGNPLLHPSGKLLSVAKAKTGMAYFGFLVRILDLLRSYIHELVYLHVNGSH